MPNKKMRLGDIIIEAGILTIDQLEDALVLQKQKKVFILEGSFSQMNY